MMKSLRPALNIGTQHHYLQEMKLQKGFWCAEDLEDVFPNIVIGGDGQIKTDPIHIFVPDLMQASMDEMVIDAFTCNGLQGYLEMMLPPFTSSNQNLRRSQGITLLTTTGMRYYRHIVNQVGSCPALGLLSREPSTKKTSTVQIGLKQSSDASHFLAPNSSNAAIDLAKSKTSLPVLCDDIESQAQRNKLIMDSFNGATKTTIGRGKEDKLAGQILTFNIKPEERIPEKIDEGRLFLQLYEKQMDVQSLEDIYDEKTAFKAAMNDPGVPRDFLAKVACRFIQKPGQKSEFQIHHKTALLLLAQVKPDYDSRKLECYALPLAMFLLLEKEVLEKEDETVTRLFVEAFKDRDCVIDGLRIEMDKVDLLMESMGRHRGVLPSYSDLLDDCVVDVEMSRAELEVRIINLLQSFEGSSQVEISKYLRVHTELHNSGQKMLSIANNRLAKRKDGKSWKDMGFPRKHTDILEKVKTFTNMNSRNEMTGSATGSAMSRQISLKILSPELVRKVMVLLEMEEEELFEDEDEAEDDTEENQMQSQDFPLYSQSKGGDTVRVCKVCPYQTQTSEDLEMHMEKHSVCSECGKRVMDEDALKAHKIEHERFTCSVCGKEVLNTDKTDHIQMHARQELFKKTLDSGKTLKKPKTKPEPKSTTGYNVFVKTNHTKIKEQNPGMTSDQIRKLVSAEWKSLGIVGQQVYKDMAKSGGEGEGPGKAGPKENQLNKVAPDADQGRIHPCNICGALYKGKPELDNHILLNHSAAGPSQQSQAAVDLTGDTPVERTEKRKEKRTEKRKEERTEKRKESSEERNEEMPEERTEKRTKEMTEKRTEESTEESDEERTEEITEERTGERAEERSEADTETSCATNQEVTQMLTLYFSSSLFQRW